MPILTGYKNTRARARTHTHTKILFEMHWVKKKKEKKNPYLGRDLLSHNSSKIKIHSLIILTEPNKHKSCQNEILLAKQI